MNTAVATLNVGDVVKLTNPTSPAEADARYDLIEHNGSRVMISLRCDLTIRPVETVAVTEIERA